MWIKCFAAGVHPNLRSGHKGKANYRSTLKLLSTTNVNYFKNEKKIQRLIDAEYKNIIFVFVFYFEVFVFKDKVQCLQLLRVIRITVGNYLTKGILVFIIRLVFSRGFLVSYK